MFLLLIIIRGEINGMFKLSRDTPLIRQKDKQLLCFLRVLLPVSTFGASIPGFLQTRYLIFMFQFQFREAKETQINL